MIKTLFWVTGLFAISSSTSVGQTTVDQIVGKWKDSCRQIETVSIKARQFRQGGDRILPLTAPEIDSILELIRDPGNIESQEILIKGVVDPGSKFEKLWGKLVFSADGNKVSEQGVIDRRSDGLVEALSDLKNANNPSGGSQVDLYNVGQSRGRSVSIGDFADELAPSMWREWDIKSESDGFALLTDAPSGGSTQISVAVPSMVVRSIKSFKGSELQYLKVKLGEIQTEYGVSFPLVSGKFRFEHGKLTSVDIIAIDEVVLNQQLDDSLFAMPIGKGDLIVDNRADSSKVFESQVALQNALDMPVGIESSLRQTQQTTGWRGWWVILLGVGLGIMYFISRTKTV